MGAIQGTAAAAGTRIGFQDVQYALQPMNRMGFVLVHTLPPAQQSCLIQGTLRAEQEEAQLNQMLKNGAHRHTHILVYGKHACDETAVNRVTHLRSLGFTEVYHYVGGLFEWLVLQDTFGDNQFPTSGKESDLLRFMPPQQFGVARLENGRD